MSTNIAKIFLKFVDRHFPRTHRLHNIFNSNTMKVSYSCMTNVQQLIKKQNNFIQNKKNKTTLSCNCRDKNGCPLNGNCRTDNIIYKANLKKSCLFPIHRPGEIKNSHEPPAGRNSFFAISLSKKIYDKKI